jgi:hypothetical protein
VTACAMQVGDLGVSQLVSCSFVLSFGVPWEVVPLWLCVSNHKREMI